MNIFKISEPQLFLWRGKLRSVLVLEYFFCIFDNCGDHQPCYSMFFGYDSLLFPIFDCAKNVNFLAQRKLFQLLCRRNCWAHGNTNTGTHFQHNKIMRRKTWTSLMQVTARELRKKAKKMWASWGSLSPRQKKRKQKAYFIVCYSGYISRFSEPMLPASAYKTWCIVASTTEKKAVPGVSPAAESRVLLFALRRLLADNSGCRDGYTEIEELHFWNTRP